MIKEKKLALFAFPKNEFKIVEKEHCFAAIGIINPKDFTRKQTSKVLKEIEEIRKEANKERLKYKLKLLTNVAG